MTTILDKIFADKKEELDSTVRDIPLSAVKGRISECSAPMDVERVLSGNDGTKIIAEIKLRTPFKGELRSGMDPMEIAGVYSYGGAAALSILTESKYFGGGIDVLHRARAAVDIPLLRKDFIFAEYQVYEARANGADFFLLIATWLDQNHLADLLALGKGMGFNALVETHCEKDIEKALHAGASIIGINNRDLSSGKTDLGIARRLIPMAQQVPGSILVCESGIHGRKEIEEFEKQGAHAFLIGESLMTAPDISLKLKELIGDNE